MHTYKYMIILTNTPSYFIVVYRLLGFIWLVESWGTSLASCFDCAVGNTDLRQQTHKIARQKKLNGIFEVCCD